MAASSPETRIDPGTAMGRVALTVADLDRARAFYERAVGLQVLDAADGTVRLGADGRTPLVELAGDPAAPAAPRRASGLFHLALLVPGRAELARAVRRVIDAGWRFTGASDHLVSEALYLDDPEGNGIEIYRDRPAEGWSYEGGELRMATLPLDLDAVMAELPDGTDPGMAAATRIGHVHLKVDDIGAGARFYERLVGFDVTVRSYPSALFLSAGGYHHHLGTNTWTSAGAPAPPPGTRGLRDYTITVPSIEEVGRVAERLAAGGVEPEPADGEVRAVDPSGNRLVVRA